MIRTLITAAALVAALAVSSCTGTRSVEVCVAMDTITTPTDTLVTLNTDQPKERTPCDT